jgi:hypothetical protein
MDRTDINRLQAQIDALAQQTQVFDAQTRTLARRLRWWRGLAGGLLVLAVLTWALPAGTAQEDAIANSEKEKKTLEQRVAALESLLKHFSRKGYDVTITGANLHLVNGLGRTSCTDDQGQPMPNCPNGLGNLIVGYNETRGEDIRTGSHNVVVGIQHNFSSFGGLVVGEFHTLSGDFAVVTGGQSNTASGSHSSVSGGEGNIASGFFAVSSGVSNTASGFGSVVSGGQFNTASGEGAAVSGGSGNTASGEGSAVSGGSQRTASGQFDWVAGSLVEDD